jgi:hypothetical protein
MQLLLVKCNMKIQMMDGINDPYYICTMSKSTITVPLMTIASPTAYSQSFAVSLHCVELVVCVTDGHKVSRALETLVYKAVPVRVPTCTGELPTVRVATGVCGV